MIGIQQFVSEVTTPCQHALNRVDVVCDSVCRNAETYLELEQINSFIRCQSLRNADMCHYPCVIRKMNELSFYRQKVLASIVIGI